MTHTELTHRAEKWLRSIGCSVIFREFVTRCSEQPDAIGWRDTRSFMVECKASRADFLSDKNKFHRKNPQYALGDWRFYMCPPEIIQPSDIPDGWGLLWVYDRQVKRVHGVPKGNTGWYRTPFQGHKVNESILLLSALRRLELRGYMPEIYKPLSDVTMPDKEQIADRVDGEAH